MKKVILADDNYIVSEGIRMNIEWDNLEAEVVFTAQNGQEVLEYMKADEADLIITDIEMPNIDGCTLSEYLSQSRFKMRLERNERDKTGKAEITRDRANLTETILRVCDSDNEKIGQNFISVFEVMENKRIIG